MSSVSLDQLAPKLDSMARCILRIESKKPFSLEELTVNYDLQDILSTNISRMIQLAVDVAAQIISESGEAVPDTMKASIATLERLGWITAGTRGALQAAVGLRNIMIHEYEEIEWSIVHRVCDSHLDDLRRFGREISAAASRQPTEE